MPSDERAARRPARIGENRATSGLGDFMPNRKDYLSSIDLQRIKAIEFLPGPVLRKEGITEYHNGIS